MRGRKADQQGAKTGGPDESVWGCRRTRRSGSGRRTKRGGRLAATIAAVVLCTAAGAWGIDNGIGFIPLVFQYHSCQLLTVQKLLETVVTEAVI